MGVGLKSREWFREAAGLGNFRTQGPRRSALHGALRKRTVAASDASLRLCKVSDSGCDEDLGLSKIESGAEAQTTCRSLYLESS